MDDLQAVLIAQALAPHERDFNLDLVYGHETDARTVLALCAAFPMMAERRVVVVRNFELLADNEAFRTYAERPNPHAIVLLVCGGKVNGSAHPYRALREHAVWAEFKPFRPEQMQGWIQQRAAAAGYQIHPEAVGMLAEYVGTNLRAAAIEIDKLATYAAGRTRLTADDVLHATGQTREYNVFELQRAVGEHRYPDAMRITERLLQQSSQAKGEAILIVSVLTSYFLKLWKLQVAQRRGVPEKALAERIGVNPYFLKEYVFSARRFAPDAIHQAFLALLAADFELKGGAERDERLVLALLFHKLLRPEARAVG